MIFKFGMHVQNMYSDSEIFKILIQLKVIGKFNRCPKNIALENILKKLLYEKKKKLYNKFSKITH